MLWAAAGTARRLGAGVSVILPRAAGVVMMARQAAEGNAVGMTAELRSHSITLRFSANALAPGASLHTSGRQGLRGVVR